MLEPLEEPPMLPPLLEPEPSPPEAPLLPLVEEPALEPPLAPPDVPPAPLEVELSSFRHCSFAVPVSAAQRAGSVLEPADGEAVLLLPPADDGEVVLLLPLAPVLPDVPP